MDAAFIGNMFLKSSFNFIEWKKFLCVALLLAGTVATTQAAQSVTLAWNPSSGSSVVGYRVYYGTSSGTYTTSVDVGNNTTVTLSNLTAGATYYFVVKAYDSGGLESVASNEASGLVTGALTVVLSTPGSSTNFNGPAVITLSATAAEIGGSVAKVEFYSGAVKLSESTSTPFTTQWVAQPGNYALSAVAYDSTGAVVQSGPVSVTVTHPAISAMQRMTDGSYQLTLTAAPGRSNSVYVSTDLQTWTLLTTVMNTTGTLAVVDPQAVNVTRRFYRMVAN